MRCDINRHHLAMLVVQDKSGLTSAKGHGSHTEAYTSMSTSQNTCMCRRRHSTL
jgi:hypothetical protein